MGSDIVPVTVVVCCYNQQDYIVDCVKGVFSQDYPVFEFIFSDDCSTDSCFDFLQKAVAEFGKGRNVVVRRNDKNLGLIDHINLVAGLARGELLVLAAGDDISLPQRVSRLVDTYQSNDKPMLIHSKALVIDQLGDLTGEVVPAEELRRVPMIGDVTFFCSIYLGASGAWSRELLDRFGSINYRYTYEDLVMGFRAALCGRVAYLDEAVLHYREGVGVSSAWRGVETIESRLARIRLERDTLLQRIDDVRHFTGVMPVWFASLRKRASRLIVRADFYENRRALLKHLFLMPRAFVSGISTEFKFVRNIMGSAKSSGLH